MVSEYHVSCAGYCMFCPGRACAICIQALEERLSIRHWSIHGGYWHFRHSWLSTGYSPDFVERTSVMVSRLHCWCPFSGLRVLGNLAATNSQYQALAHYYYSDLSCANTAYAHHAPVPQSIHTSRP